MPSDQKIAIPLTPSEQRYFGEIFGSKFDLEDLHQEAPSASFDGKNLYLNPAHLDGLSKYEDDTVILSRGEGYSRLPPSFYKGSFAKKGYSAFLNSTLKAGDSVGKALGVVGTAANFYDTAQGINTILNSRYPGPTSGSPFMSGM